MTKKPKALVRAKTEAAPRLPLNNHAVLHEKDTIREVGLEGSLNSLSPIARAVLLEADLTTIEQLKSFIEDPDWDKKLLRIRSCDRATLIEIENAAYGATSETKRSNKKKGGLAYAHGHSLSKKARVMTLDADLLQKDFVYCNYHKPPEIVRKQT